MKAELKIDWTRVRDQLLDTLCEIEDLDKALAPLFALVDPENEHDLGGHAGMHFSGDRYYELGNEITAERWWVIINHAARRAELDDLIAYLKKVT